MIYKLSKRSLKKLEGVNEQLVGVVHSAIQYTAVDFGVTCGTRTFKEQQALVASGASKTMNSKHLTGDAVDVVAYIGSRISWELHLYDDIAEGFRRAAKEHSVKLRWGAAWHIPDICAYQGTMEQAMLDYIDLRRSIGKRPFIDGPHFELMDK